MVNQLTPAVNNWGGPVTLEACSFCTCSHYLVWVNGIMNSFWNTRTLQIEIWSSVRKLIVSVPKIELLMGNDIIHANNIIITAIW